MLQSIETLFAVTLSFIAEMVSGATFSASSEVYEDSDSGWPARRGVEALCPQDWLDSDIVAVLFLEHDYMLQQATYDYFNEFCTNSVDYYNVRQSWDPMANWFDAQHRTTLCEMDATECNKGQLDWADDCTVHEFDSLVLAIGAMEARGVFVHDEIKSVLFGEDGEDDSDIDIAEVFEDIFVQAEWTDCDVECAMHSLTQFDALCGAFVQETAFDVENGLGDEYWPGECGHWCQCDECEHRFDRLYNAEGTREANQWRGVAITPHPLPVRKDR